VYRYACDVAIDYRRWFERRAFIPALNALLLRPTFIPM